MKQNLIEHYLVEVTVKPVTNTNPRYSGIDTVMTLLSDQQIVFLTLAGHEIFNYYESLDCAPEILEEQSIETRLQQNLLNQPVPTMQEL